MEGKIPDPKKPDPRWQNFIEQFDANGKKIGFKLQGNDYLFRYNQDGGWMDEQGRYYDCQGYLIDQALEDEVDEESDSEADDDQILDEFEKMLIEQEQGIIRTKIKAETKSSQKPQDRIFDLDNELKTYIQKLKNIKQLRQGLSPQVWIFYKMKSNLYERITPAVEKQQNTNSRNDLIKKIKLQIEAKRKQLLEANKWLSGEFFLDYSGTSLQEGLYDRYWYGYVKVTGDKFFSVLQQIKKSKEFSLLKSKTLYALKSKFYLKSKMKATIQQLKNKIEKVNQENAILVKINNLPEQFPISFVTDLVELSGGHLEDIEDIDIIDNFSADLICKKRTAVAFTNVEGYPHDEKQYIWIEIKDTERLIKPNEQLFNVQIDAEYKVPTRETADTLALESGRAEIAKVGEIGDEFRLVIGQSALKKILMFRGETLNVVRIVRFEKKTEEIKPEEKKA